MAQGFVCEKEKCEFYKSEPMISFTKFPETDTLELCTHSGSRCSFGCMSACPKTNKVR